MNTMHITIQKQLKQANKKDIEDFKIGHYLGTSHPITGISTADHRWIAREFYKNHSNLSFEDFINLLNSLNHGTTFSEKIMGPFLLSFYKKYHSQIRPEHINSWLENLEGWAEIDSLCQSTFHAETLLENWNLWDKALDKFSKDRNINKRRASLVLLCKPIRESNDERLKIRALQNVERLKHEKQILITKAISWILRVMTKNFKKEVTEYLEKNADSLPKIAVRETRKKLLTGKK